MIELTNMSIGLGFTVNQDGAWIKPDCRLTTKLNPPIQLSTQAGEKELTVAVERVFELVAEEMHRELERLGLSLSPDCYIDSSLFEEE